MSHDPKDPRYWRHLASVHAASTNGHASGSVREALGDYEQRTRERTEAAHPSAPATTVRPPPPRALDKTTAHARELLSQGASRVAITVERTDSGYALNFSAEVDGEAL